MLPVPGGDDPVKKYIRFFILKDHIFNVSSDTDAVYTMELSIDSDAV